MNLWVIAVITAFIGFLPGVLLFPWLASPLGPGLWKLATPFTRIFLTVSQFIRKRGVLVKTKEGYYEIGTYVEDGEDAHAVLSDRTVPIDPDNLRWGLFGKKPFGITWEAGTDLHQRITNDTATDGGGYSVNVGALHRYLRGANDPDAITRTEEKAKAEHGMGSGQISDLVMGVLIVVLLLLGSFTTYLML